MPTAPEKVRRALLRVARGARAEVRAVVAAAPKEPAGWRAALFASAPLIASEYNAGAATLALDWFDEIRFEASPGTAFTPTPRLLVSDDAVAAKVASTTEKLRDLERFDDEVAQIMAEAAANLEAEFEKQVADTFRETITSNTKDDPAAIGWQRFARPEACKFCLMLAARGAVYKADTARFAAHGAVMAGGRKGGNCMCIAGPAYGGKEIWAEATPMQYTAANPMTDAQRAQLRKYLNKNFPDAPG